MSCRERRADPEMRSAKRTTLCLYSPGLSGYHTTQRCTESIQFLWPLSRKFSGLLVRPWISSAVADNTVSLPGFLDLSLNVCSPSQVLWDVYTEVLEAAHPLHKGPTDHKRSVGPQLSLPEVYHQLFSFAHVQREMLPWHHDVSLSTSSKYAVSSLLEMRTRTTISSANLTIEVELWEDTQSWVYRE